LIISFGNCAYARSLFGAALTTGDLNRDNIADIIIGAPTDLISPVSAGVVAVLYGRTSFPSKSISKSIDLCDLEPSSGVIFVGEAAQGGGSGDASGH
jgi:hypothetical protein